MAEGRELLAPWTPSAAEPFDLAKAGHLLGRAAFDASLETRRTCVQRGLEHALGLLEGRGDDADVFHDEVVALDDFTKLRAYRVWRMLAGRGRLRERMSFFWHGHFATSNAKVLDPVAMANHFAVFDRHGLGRFDDLLLAVCRDPAMLRWLDNDTSVAGSPNENFARELFELFTLGLGNYSERDVQEAARAFTGWHVRNGCFRFVGRKHDRGPKEIFGRRGRFDGEDVVALVLEHEASAAFVARALLAFFVHPEPDDAEVAALAACYREHDRDVGATVDTLLRSRLFFSPRAFRSRIKDPVDLVVGSVRSLGATASPLRLARAAAAMGQSVGEPPSVAGWPGERAWLNSATWLLRSNFAAELGTRYALQPDLAACIDSIEDAVDVLLDGALSPESRAALDAVARGAADAAAIFQAVADLPEAQLL